MLNYRNINYDTTGLTEEASLMNIFGLDLDTEMKKAIDTLLDDVPGQITLVTLIKSKNTNKGGRHDFLRMNAEIMEGTKLHVKIMQMEIDENRKL